jgi:hypothetical protein
LVGAGGGYLIGNANEHTTTLLSTTTTTSMVTTTSPPNEPCNIGVWKAPIEGLHRTPVLLMRPYSTAFVCVTFQSGWKGNQSLFATYYSDLLSGRYGFQDLFIPINWKCTTVNGTTNCRPVYSNSFSISALPSSIFPEGSTNYVYVVYAVTAYRNSTGFYDETAPWGLCGGLPMAVGYSAAQVNVSDFTSPPSIPCLAPPFNPIAEYVTGMNVTFIN